MDLQLRAVAMVRTVARIGALAVRAAEDEQGSDLSGYRRGLAEKRLDDEREVTALKAKIETGLALRARRSQNMVLILVTVVLGLCVILLVLTRW